MFANEGSISLPTLWSVLLVSELRRRNALDLDSKGTSQRVGELFSECLERVGFARVILPNGETIKAWPDFLTRYDVEYEHHEHIEMYSGIVAYNPILKATGWFEKVFIPKGRQTLNEQAEWVTFSIGFGALFAVFSLVFSFYALTFESESQADRAILIFIAAGGLITSSSFLAFSARWLFMSWAFKNPFGNLEGCPVVLDWKEIALFLSEKFDHFSEPNEIERVEKEIGPVSPAKERSYGIEFVNLINENPTLTKADLKATFRDRLGARSFERAWASARIIKPEISTPGRKTKT